MIIVDAHQDIAYTALSMGRDYAVSALRKRLLEYELAYPGATLGLPEAIAGRVAVAFATLFVAPHDPNSRFKPVGAEERYRSPREAHDLALKQHDYYQRLADENSKIRLITRAADLDSVLETWDDARDIRERQQGLVMLMEGADPVLEPAQFAEWYARGVRLVGPAWSSTRYSAGNGHEGGLTPQGRELLDVMAAHNVILDLSHLSERAAHEALDQYGGVVIASHSNPRRFRDSDRHLSDDLIRRLGERDGVMGVVLYNRFLDGTWTPTDGKNAVTLDHVADAIDHVCQLTGSALHVGIGSDFDGGFGFEAIPQELDTEADLMRIAIKLMERGYDATAIEGIMGMNMLRKLRAVLD